MHRSCLLTLLVGAFGIGLAPSAVAQPSFDAGITIGMNVATLRAASADRLGYRTAAVGGLFGQLRVADPLTVRGELLFSQKGTTIDSDQGELTLKANYLELPVLMIGRLPSVGTYHPYLLAGPALGIKLYERQGAPGFSFRTEEAAFKRTDIGVTVGAGASLGGPGALEAEVRYTLGVVDVTEPVSTAPLDEDLPADGANGVFSVMLRLTL